MKYIFRAGKKGNLQEDLEKARWYIDRAVKVIRERDAKQDEFLKAFAERIEEIKEMAIKSKKDNFSDQLNFIHNNSNCGC